MIGFDEALELIDATVAPLGREAVSLEDALGRVLAAPVVAQVDSPPADSSAMDGYAVRDSDLPGTLRVIGESFPGRGFDRSLTPGACVRIFTGAPLPEGADRVAIQEEVERSGDEAIVPDFAASPRFIRARGSDFHAGDVLMEPGLVLTPRALVTAAGADLSRLEVWRRPRVVILATGDELAAPGEARRNPGCIPESVSIGIAGFARQRGAQVIASRRLRDDRPTLEQAAGETVGQADLVIVTGGASVGEKDFAKPMFEPLGLELVFSKLAVKPGKPVWLGRCRGALVLGLPGNPTSAMVTARLFLAPLLAGLSGGEAAHRWSKLPLAGELPACEGRETFVRARRTLAGAAPVSNQDSSAQAALAHADLLIRCRPGDAARGPGEWVDALDF